MITGWLTTFGRYLLLMGRTFSVPERFRMFWKQYVKEMSQLVSMVNRMDKII